MTHNGELDINSIGDTEIDKLNPTHFIIITLIPTILP